MSKIYDMANAVLSRCDGALRLDGVGFNKIDSPIVRQILSEPISEYGARKLAFLIRKYKKQLEAMGYIQDDMKIIYELIEKHSEKLISRDGDKITIKFPYDANLVSKIKNHFETRKWNRYEKRWEVNLSEYESCFNFDGSFTINFDKDEIKSLLEKDEIERNEIKKKAKNNTCTKSELMKITDKYVACGAEDIFIYYPFDKDLNDDLWELCKCRWDNGNRARYTKIENITVVYDFLKDKGFSFSKKFFEVYKIVRKEKEIDEKEKQKSISASKATDSDINIPVPDGLSYLPFQKAGVDFIIQHNGRALLADEMGLGKTIQSIAWMNLKKDVYPTLIICPASLKWNWKKELEKWIIKDDNIKSRSLTGDFSIQIVTSKTESVIGDVVIINYDIVKKFKDMLLDYNFKTVILDESHMVKNYKAQRTKVTLEIANKADYVLALSGTPFLNRPIEGWTTLNLIRPDVFKKFWDYSKTYCNAHHSGYGWDLNGSSNLEELQELLRANVMLRRIKKDVLKELPAKRRIMIPLRLDDNGEQNLSWLKSMLIDRALMHQSNADTSKLQSKTSAILAEIEDLKQKSAKKKLPVAIDFIKTFIAEKKLVVFAHHKFVIDALMNEFKDVAVKIDGTTKDRETPVEQFQNNPDVKLFIGSIHASGLGITLTAASDVIFVEFDWTPALHSQSEDRCHRIGQKDSVNCYYLALDNSIDGYIVKLLTEKQNIIDWIVDDVRKAEEGNKSIFDGLLDVMEES